LRAGRAGSKAKEAMTIVYYVAVVLHLVACFFLIAVVLLQQGKGQDLASAFGGGGTQTAFGPRGSANVLSRATTILAALFMVTSLLLSTVRHKAKGLLDEVPGPAPAASTATPLRAPAASPSPTAH
jgi:preprotein translocase subunit SecG